MQNKLCDRGTQSDKLHTHTKKKTQKTFLLNVIPQWPLKATAQGIF